MVSCTENPMPARPPVPVCAAVELRLRPWVAMIKSRVDDNRPLALSLNYR